MRRALMLLPLAIFLIVAVFLYRGLFLNPSELPSALIGKPFPVFTLPSVKAGEPAITQADLLGKPALVNVWGTWCVACKVEHPVLNKLASQGVVIHGINYKDDTAAARDWLRDFHDPYQLNISDVDGSLGLDLGVYGAPETFLIDHNGIIRHKYVGVIDERVWQQEIAPLYQAMVDDQ
ncbi:DsbE family thiol:disulfide interchange protein [Stutzerimonas urumqiensis]|uniref:DsbE family thiol:disulfide interchange protein n=1 Tax=Stutzerimonas urumqiensis TaxID=638269 RepID=UPI003BA85C69